MKKFSLPVLAAALAAALHGQSLPSTPGPAPEAPAAVRDSLSVQKARNEHVAGRGLHVFYHHDWDLSALPPYRPEGTVSGTVRMWGLNYLGDSHLEKYWENGFCKYHPAVRFEYHLPTSVTAVPGLVTGQANLGADTPMYFFERLEFARTFHYEPTTFLMVTGSYDVPGWANAIGIFVHHTNPLGKITLQQLDAIFGAEREGGWVGLTWHPEFARGPEGNIRTWGQLGLTGAWADKPIHVYGLNLRYGQAIGFSDRVLKGSDKWNEDLIMYANYARPDGTLAIGANQLIQDLAHDPYGIAYSGIQNLMPAVKCLPLGAKEGGPYLPLTMENVQSRQYPYVSQEFWDVNRPPGKPVEPAVREYLRYTLSREGQEAVVRDGKFLPLTAAAAARALRRLDQEPTPFLSIAGQDADGPSPHPDKQAHYTSQWDLAQLPAYVPGAPVSGRIRIWGLSGLGDGNLGADWERGFRRYHPGADFEWHTPTAEVGVASLITGAGDLGASFKIRFSELLGFQRLYNRDPVEVPMVTGSYDVPGWGGALVVIVPKGNPLAGLTLGQLDGVFGSARTGGWGGTEWFPEYARGADRNIRTWGQLGLKGEWADRPIHLYGVNLRYDASVAFSDQVLKSSDKWNERMHMYANYVRPDGTMDVATARVREALARDPAGMAYGGADELTPATRAVPVAAADGQPFVAPTLETVRERTYPLARTEYWYFNRQPGSPVDPKVREFLRYTLSREGQEAVQRDGKFLPLTPELARQALAAIDTMPNHQ